MPVVFQASVAGVYGLVQLVSKVGPDAGRVDKDATWMRSVLAERKARAVEEILKVALAFDSLSRVDKGTTTDLPDACEEYVREWEQVSTDDRRVAAAHWFHDKGMGMLLYWVIVAGVLFGATMALPHHGSLWSLLAGVTLVTEVVVVIGIHRCRQFLIDERKSPKYIRPGAK